MPRLADPETNVMVCRVRGHRGEKLFQTFEGIRLKTREQRIHHQTAIIPNAGEQVQAKGLRQESDGSWPAKRVVNGDLSICSPPDKVGRRKLPGLNKTTSQ